MSRGVSTDHIAQEKIDGVRALLEWGKLRGRRCSYPLPGQLPECLADFVFDGELKDGIYHVFDIVACEGQEVSWQPLSSRLQLLEAASALFPRWMVKVPDTKNIAALLSAVLARGGEGVVVKKLSAGWGKLWIKCKREATHDLIVESLDADKRSAACYQISNGKRLDVGRVFLGNAFPSVTVGDVIEVTAISRHASGKLREAHFLRIRHDKPASACVV